jgi:hypothetical protein
MSYNLKKIRLSIYTALRYISVVCWIEMAQDRDKWPTVVNAVMNLRFPENAGNFLTNDLFASQDGLCSM